MTDFTHSLEERLLRYVQIDTEADDLSTIIPSTARQLDLQRMLVAELSAIGAADVRLTDQGIVYATVPSTVQRATPVIALLAHVDTAPAYSGAGVKPIVHRNYDGADIVLPDDPTKVISPGAFPYLATKKGDTLITASGTTLLGADDKSGVAIIMTLAEHLLRNPGIPHGTIRLCFTIDEEVGTGIRNVTKEDLGADFAYTLDGGPLGNFAYETFSADKARVTIEGVSIHPGTAFGKLVNALLLAAQVIAALPHHTRTPETTRDREGFVHVTALRGTAARAEIDLILRDFESDRLAAHGDLLRSVCDAIQKGEPRARITCAIEKQYRNMRVWLENDMRPVEVAVRAMRSLGIEPTFESVRGGTDGSQLTERGVPCPNLFTGQQNLHGPFEWISVQDMERSLRVCLAMAQVWAEA